MHWFCLGDSRLTQVNNNPRANYFQQGRLTLYKLCTGHPRTPGIDLIYQIYTVLRTHLLGRGWSGSATSARRRSAFLDYILWVCQSLLVSFLYWAGKASLVSTSGAILFRLNCRIPCHLFACHWIRIASIVLCFVLQRTPTNENNGGTEWQGIQQLLPYFYDPSLFIYRWSCVGKGTWRVNLSKFVWALRQQQLTVE